MRKEPNPPPTGIKPPPPPAPPRPMRAGVDPADVALLHRMLNAAMFGWPSEKELGEAHALLDRIAKQPHGGGHADG